MDDGIFRRLSVIAGGGVFILTLLSQLTRPNLSLAVLVALGCGAAVGFLAYVAGAIVVLARPASPPAPEPAPEDSQDDGDTMDRLASLEKTQRIGGSRELGDLQQTVRLDEAGLGEILPGITVEELEKEKENLLQALKEQGIEGVGSASENGIERN